MAASIASLNPSETANKRGTIVLVLLCTIHTIYLTIIPRTCDGYEFLDSGRGAEHRLSYHKLIFNKREWNNCFIKYQTLDKNISNIIFYRLEFSAILRENFP